MKVYKFIFFVGFLNLTVPFLGIPFIYKNYVLLSLAVITLGYALIVRTVEKEKENFISRNDFESVETDSKIETIQEWKIEDVVEMTEENKRVIVSDVIIKRKAGRPKLTKEKINI